MNPSKWDVPLPKLGSKFDRRWIIPTTFPTACQSKQVFPKMSASPEPSLLTPTRIVRYRTSRFRNEAKLETVGASKYCSECGSSGQSGRQVSSCNCVKLPVIGIV